MTVFSYRSVLLSLLVLLAINSLSLASSVDNVQTPFSDAHDPLVYSTHINSEYPAYSIRIKEQHHQLCHAKSKQYTGWLDFNGKHLFFWYFDSLNDPKNDPLTLWMTGGPGCSGMIGMLLELGPCLVNEHGNSTHANPYGWTRNSSMIFIDQPAGTGFSYTDPGVGLPGDSFVSASDMYIFLQIFLTQVFPEKRSLPFHISGESYGGHYVPALSAEILQQNELHFHRPKIPLKSIFVGDGFFSPLDTTWGYYETLCTTKPGIREPVFNETRCQIIAETLPRCAYVHEACYKYPDEILCKAADQVCQEIRRLFYDESHAGGRDPFDITRTCEVDGVCYSGAIMVQEYMNLPWVQKALDVPGFISNFSICSDSTVAAFDIGNDLYVNTMDQVKYTLEHGADVLIYNGNLDLACNTAGNLRWTNSLSWNGQAPFAAQDLKPWFSTVEGVTIPAGTYKEVYAFTRPDHTKKQRFSFVTIDNSGHMVPLDQPEIALDMVQKWLSGRDF